MTSTRDHKYQAETVIKNATSNPKPEYLKAADVLRAAQPIGILPSLELVVINQSVVKATGLSTFAI